MKNNNLEEQPTIVCEHCGKNLAEDQANGIFVIWQKELDTQSEKAYYPEAYYCCKGTCDRTLRRIHIQKGYSLDLWNDISSFTNVCGFVRNNMYWMDNLYRGEQLSSQAYKKLQNLLWIGLHEISKSLTPKETDTIKEYWEIRQEEVTL